MSLEDQEFLNMSWAPPANANQGPFPGYCSTCFMDGTLRRSNIPGMLICINCRVNTNFSLKYPPPGAFTGEPHKELYPTVKFSPAEELRLKDTKAAVAAGFYNEGGEERTPWPQHLFNTLYPFYMEMAKA